MQPTTTQGVFMKHFNSTQALAAVAVALGALTSASSAQAGSDVYFSIGVQVPGMYVQPAPVYVQPAPVYVQRAPVYGQPRVIYGPAPVHYGRFDDGRRFGGQRWQGRGPYGDHDRDGIANVYDSGGPRLQGRPSRLYGPYGDLDRDGVMNHRDHDIDGDGVRNRNDRVPNNPYRR
jgi:hypothetical protein